MAVADEKDKLAPQLEEARWHNRQLEKDVEQMQEKGNVAEQVTATVAHICLLQKDKNGSLGTSTANRSIHRQMLDA